MPLLKSLHVLVFLLLSVAGWSMDPPTPKSMEFQLYQELSADLIGIAEANDTEKPILITSFLQKLEVLKSYHQEISAELSKIVQGNGHIKMGDLAPVLLSMRTKFPTASLDDNTKTKLVELFSSLVLGTKILPNVVIIGRSRGGKSTFLSTMTDPLDHTLHASISSTSAFSCTVHSSHHILFFDSVKDGLYVARFIDTPGLAEEMDPHSTRKSRPDLKIIEEIVQSLNGLTIHKVIQLFPVETKGFNNLDFSAFELIKSQFSQKCVFAGAIDIIFANADEIDQYKMDVFLNNLMQRFGDVGITEDDCCVGLVSGTIFNQNFKIGDMDKINEAALTVLYRRNQIIQSIFGVEFSEGITSYIQNEDEVTVISKEAVRRLTAIVPKK